MFNLTDLYNSGNIGKKAAPVIGNVVSGFKANSPAIATGVGLVAMAAGAILLAKRHRKHADKLETSFSDLMEQSDNTDSNNRSQMENLGKNAVGLVWSFVKVYAAPTGLLVGGASLIVVGHNLNATRVRNAAAAYVTLTETYKRYRKSLSPDEEGLVLDDANQFNAPVIKEVDVVVDENGKKTKKETLRVEQPETIEGNTFSRFFDQREVGSAHFSRDPFVNANILEAVASWANTQLDIYGVVVLNDIYAELGYEKTPAGAITGWSRRSNPDSFISFGLDRPINRKAKQENRWVLSFNVDGVVYGDYAS